MTRTMYDSVNPFVIPDDAEMVAGYYDPDGAYNWSPEGWARFPNAVKVRVCGHASTNDCQVLDVEAGNATPDQAPGWVAMRRASGLATPTVYCSYSLWRDPYGVPGVLPRAFAAQGVDEPLWWIAAYPGIGERLYPGTVAHQYADVGPYDLSIVADFWPGVDDVTPAPTTKGDTEMVVKEIDDNDADIVHAWWLLTAAGATKLQTGPTSDVAYAMVAGGVPCVGLTYLTIRDIAQRIEKTRLDPTGVYDPL
jgi:hypothetical protein